MEYSTATGATPSRQAPFRYDTPVPAFADEALVLERHPFQERHLVLSLLTPGHGLQRGVLRRARTAKGSHGAASQVLSLVRVSAFRGPQAEMATINELELVSSSYPLATELPRATAASVVAELLATFCVAGEPAPLHFRLGRTALEALLAGSDPSTVVAYVELWMLALGGVLPPLDTCARCGAALTDAVRVSATDGMPRCAACAEPGSDDLDVACLELVAACRHTPLTDLTLTVPPALERWLDRRVRHEAERQLKALDFFRRYRE